MRKSFSNLKKDLSYRLGGKKRAPDRAGADAAGDSSASLLQPAASGHNEEETGISTGISQVHSRDPSPMSADEGRRDDSQRKETDVDEKEGGQRDSHLDSDVAIAIGRRPSQEDKRVCSPQPVASIPRIQEPDSMWILSPQLSCLIIPLHNAGASTVPGHVQKDPRPDESAESNTAASEKKSSWKSTAYASAKLLLRGVRDSADAFGPLKSVAGGLCFILENCEVWASLHVHHQNSHEYHSG